MTEDNQKFIETLIEQTKVQESLFRMANCPYQAAFWITERIRYRYMLTAHLLKGN